MKISVHLAVEVDPRLWSEYNGVLPTDVRDDVRSYVLSQVQCAAMIEDCDGTVTLRN